MRRDGDAQSWLANENLTVAKNINDGEKRDLADIAATRLRSVTLTSGDGKTLKVYKDQPSDANFKIADVPKGREASSEFAANNLGSVLANLRADDVAAPRTCRLRKSRTRRNTRRSMACTSMPRFWQKDNKDYAQFTASLDSDAANAEIERAQAKAKADYERRSPPRKNLTMPNPPMPSRRRQNRRRGPKPAETPKPLAVSDPAKDRQEKLDAFNGEVAALNKTFSGLDLHCCRRSNMRT